jgi:dTDP-4-dehydrorhamnose 3,5-epimerase
MGSLSVHATPLEGLAEVRGQRVRDARGSFARLFCEQDLAAIRPALHFTQVNLSETARRGSVRGMHYQKPPAAEAKLIRCLRGRVFDVAVDLRHGSPTFLRWHALELDGNEDRAVFIPEGFAHGFQALSDDAQLLYMHTMPWTPALEAGLAFDDPRLAIAWPLPVTSVSDKDRAYAPIDADFPGVLA